MSRGLERLSEATQTRLRSTQILTSLPQLVSELVQNSLDAGARHVDVGVNCEEYGCWVRDDGCGMGRQDLDALAAGGGGERYGAWLRGESEGGAEAWCAVSSKVYAPDQIGEQATFGFRGEGMCMAARVLLNTLTAAILSSSRIGCRLVLSGDRVADSSLPRVVVHNPQGSPLHAG